MVVSDAWARPTVAGQPSGAAYLAIENRGQAADKLIAAQLPQANSTELHNMAMEGTVMRMRSVDGVELPPGQTVRLKPGGLHLMLLGLKTPLKTGESLPLTLRFQHAGELTVPLTVGPAPTATAPSHGHGQGHGTQDRPHHSHR
ncbi:hypothetical protein AAW51_1983 [Caldimonas brevitalea]|uniref:Copper chaperone PCu(A)C n=2 Tax=Caldimonas brevitalea TaxID=413882 RepID=A0A0G3BGV1_9BURK|nr:hypothetical protein AAW51_1983 [Caldimonas brevitalea]